MEDTNKNQIIDDDLGDEIGQQGEYKGEDNAEDKDLEDDKGGDDSKKESEEEDEDEDSEDEDKSEDDPDDDFEEDERKPKYVRLKKHLKTEKKLREAQDEIKRLTDKLSEKEEQKLMDSIPEMDEEELKDLAGEFGVDPKNAKAFADKILKSGVKVALDIMDAKYGKKIQQIDNSITMQKQAEFFEKDFQKNLVETFTEKEDISFAKKHKERIKTLAFSEDYVKKPLSYIFNVVKSEEKNRAKSGADGYSHNKSDKDKGRYGEDLTDEQILNMGIEEADKYFEDKKKKKKGLI
jgi:hypothetical protein